MVKEERIIQAAVLVALFQLPLREVFAPITYFDELLAVLMAAAGCWKHIQGGQSHSSRRDTIAILCLIALFLFGLFCNCVSDLNTPVSAILQDSFTVAKVFLCFFGCKYYFLNSSVNSSDLIKWAAKVVRVVVIIATIGLILTYAGMLDMYVEERRFGIPDMKCYSFIYGTPGMFSQYCMMYMLVLLYDLSVNSSAKNKLPYVAALSLTWAMTLRARAFIMIVVMVMLYLLLVKSPFQNGLNAIKHRLHAVAVLLIPVCVALIVLACTQFTYYFGRLSTARSYLLYGGVKAAQEYMPLGAGFGTFGTEAAKVHYSPLYYRYGLNEHWALGPGGSELTDTFWPAILGEFGIFGLALYIIPVLIMCYEILQIKSKNLHLRLAGGFFVVYALVASVATGVFFSYTITCSMLFIGMSFSISGLNNNSTRGM